MTHALYSLALWNTYHNKEIQVYNATILVVVYCSSNLSIWYFSHLARSGDIHLLTSFFVKHAWVHFKNNNKLLQRNMRRRIQKTVTSITISFLLVRKMQRLQLAYVFELYLGTYLLRSGVMFKLEGQVKDVCMHCIPISNLIKMWFKTRWR